MKALTELFKKHQAEIIRLKASLSEHRVRATATSKHKIKLIKSEAIALKPSALDIREIVGECAMVEDYLFITFLFHQTGHKNHASVVYDTLLMKLDRASDLIMIGKQMISYGFSNGYNFFSKASTCANNVYERILVQDTFENASINYINVA